MRASTAITSTPIICARWGCRCIRTSCSASVILIYCAECSAIAIMRSAPTPARGGWDAFAHAPRFTVNFWIPFQECGIEAPGLGVVQAPFADVLSFTGYQSGAKLWDDPAPIGEYTYFRPEMKALHRNHDPDMIARMREHFSGRIATPAFRPGDAMMLSNWTLHQTHATPAMAKTRENIELRFWSAASLHDILREHGI